MDRVIASAQATSLALPARTGSGTLDDRSALVLELGQRLEHAWLENSRRRFRAWRKRAAWILVVGGAHVAKRTLDIVGALGLLMALAPLLALIAVLIKLTDRGPVLFWQKRVGRWGREFDFPKFRSMVINAEQLKDQLLTINDHKDSITFKMKRDPRITWIGRFIRKASIDELPQLWCVLRGDMSLVGPRPPVPCEVEKYTLADRRRLDVTPGLTCIWQVSGRGDIPFDKQVQLDVQYIESRSLWLDVKLLLLTVPAVLLGKGAY
jgi:lipopolysaccharide/colanic/teichoic acid biosynthesis glycosyltransferase